jgi:hypothetical protein
MSASNGYTDIKAASIGYSTALINFKNDVSTESTSIITELNKIKT